MATRRPLGRGRLEKTAETSSISMGLSTVTTPACLHAASNILWFAASAPVWLAAARSPASVRPPFNTTTGFFKPTRLADSKNRLPF